MKRRFKPGLLVSVRSAPEAAAALAGGAYIIDIKEPDHGPLGRADDGTIAAVLDVVNGRRPVSAALGELSENSPRSRDARLAFVKWGLAACNRDSLKSGKKCWQDMLTTELAIPGNPQTVIVAYADWQCAQAPPIGEVVAFACQKPGNVLLIDTYCKEAPARSKSRPTLLDWLPACDIIAICEQCRAAKIRVALAGSLTIAAIKQLGAAEPDWFAVRGAVCEECDRRGSVDANKVRELVDYLTDG
jgi:(5-formylfuran-3-yl)methyl phosphate synthase